MFLCVKNYTQNILNNSITIKNTSKTFDLEVFLFYDKRFYRSSLIKYIIEADNKHIIEMTKNKNFVFPVLSIIYPSKGSPNAAKR